MSNHLSSCSTRAGRRGWAAPQRDIASIAILERFDVYCWLESWLSWYRAAPRGGPRWHRDGGLLKLLCESWLPVPSQTLSQPLLTVSHCCLCHAARFISNWGMHIFAYSANILHFYSHFKLSMYMHQIYASARVTYSVGCCIFMHIHAHFWHLCACGFAYLCILKDLLHNLIRIIRSDDLHI